MFYSPIPHPCQPNSFQHCPLPRLWLTTDPMIPHFHRLCCCGCSGDQLLVFRTLLPLIPGPSAASLFAVQDTRAIALVQCRGRQMPYTYKPLSNPRPGMLLITYTYPCTLLYHNHLNLFSERTELKREMERRLICLPYISAVCCSHKEMTTNGRG